MKAEAGEGFKIGRSHIVKRPRLTRLLDETRARIILLIAPAGYGKTTLAREWLRDRPHGWYRGNSGTSDVAALALGLARAATAVVPGAGQRLATRLRAPTTVKEELELLAELLTEDLRQWPPDAWLVFDNYHFACDSEPAERFVEHFASSSTVRLLIASRSRPNWATARRLLYGESFEIGRNQLAMSQDEAHTVLKHRVEVEPAGLIALADGWPALVGVAALTKELDLPSERLPEELYSYFAEELYQGLSREVRQGLRRLALASVVTIDIARTLVGDNAALVMSEAASHGFFLASTQDRLEFHPLLRTFLASKFIENCDDASGHLVSELTREFIKRSDWDEAFELIVRFSRNDLLVELFETALPEMVQESRLPTLTRWIEAATSLGVVSPVIGVAEAEVALKHADLRRAEAIAMQASLQLPSGHSFRSKALWLAGTSAHLTWRDNDALDYFRRAQEVASSDIDSRQALWGRFLATETLEREDEAQALLDEYCKHSTAAIDDLLRIATGRLRLALLTGEIPQALEAHESLVLLADRSSDPLIQTSFLNAYAGLLSLAGRYDDASVAANSELAFSNKYSLAFVTPFAHLHLAEANWGLRNFRACKISIAASERTSRSDNELLFSILATLRARLCLAKGAPQAAIEALDVGHRWAIGCSMHAEYLAWWAFAQALAGQGDQAMALAQRAESMSHRAEVAGLTPWTRVILSLHTRETARNMVAAAFRNACATGNIDAFVAAYRAEPEILCLLLQNDANRDALKIILERSRDYLLGEKLGLRVEIPRDSRVGMILTKREHEVIELVSHGLTNKQIGRALFITEATVKVHLRKICRKLDVRTRTEAAMRFADLSG